MKPSDEVERLKIVVQWAPSKVFEECAKVLRHVGPRGSVKSTMERKSRELAQLLPAIRGKTLKNSQTHFSIGRVFCDSALLPRFGHNHL